MTELRDWYLGALGIVQYVSRIDPVSDEIPADYDEPAPRPTEEPRTATPSPARQILDAVPATPAIAPDKPKAPTVQEEDAAPFRLAFWQPAQNIVVLSALSPGGRPTPGQTDMLVNLLKAIGRLDSELPRAEWIDWPLARQPGMTIGDARDFVETFLEVKCRVQSFDTALVMGCGNLLENYQGSVGEQVSLRCQATGILTHSLEEMERQPELKRDTWNAIRHLGS